MSDKTFGPWTLTTAEQDRLDTYQKLRDLATKDAEKHDKLFQRDKQEALAAQMQAGKVTANSCLPQLYVNLPSLVARSAADLVLSQPPVIRGETDEITARIKAIRERSKLDACAWRAIFWTSILGDSYFTIADKLAGEKRVPVIKLRRALNSIARNVRPEDSDGERSLVYMTMIGDVKLFTQHTSGAVSFTAFKKDEKGAWVPCDLPKPFEPKLETREPSPLFVHLPALRGDDSDEGFGESDILDTDELAFEISNRLRQTQKILDKHAEPAQNVPEGTLDDKGLHNARLAKVFERDISGQGMEYVTWQSQLKEGYDEIDRLLKLVALITETPVALWGLDEDGQAESGRALKFRLLTGLGKARRTGMMLRAGLADAIRLALRREDVIAGKQPGEYVVTVELSETFIADEQETAEHVVKMRQANAMSVKEAVRIGQGKTGEELEEEVQAIENEQPDEIGFESERNLGIQPIETLKPDVEPAPSSKKGEAPVDKATPIEPLDINGAVVQGIIALVKTRLMTIAEARERLGLAKLDDAKLQEIEKLIMQADPEGKEPPVAA